MLEYFREGERREDWFLFYDDGYRSWRYRTDEIAAAARALAGKLREAGCAPGDRVILWGENRPGWVVALWACLLEGVVAVPVDFRSSTELVAKVAGLTQAKLMIAGVEVVPPTDLGIPVWPMAEAERERAPVADQAIEPRPDLAEILFTSGATAEPKGVLITHGNLLANLEPVEQEIARYRRKPIVRWLAEPLFFPVRFLNLLPLSHLFGQTMGAFIPPMIDGEVVFLKGHNPAEIVRQVKRRRISVVVAVPKMLELLRAYLEQVCPEVREPRRSRAKWGVLGFLPAWWQYRRAHRALGWKFWAFVVGAAPLDPELEGFWRKLGYVVVQGYGLTETAPIVSLNHPFHASEGTVGKAMPGVEVKLAEDGEILVRGANVTQGYFGGAPSMAADGWFHTGDVGEMDAGGTLRIRGRKKEMIVTPEGMNVFPEDVERVLEEIAGVAESAVIEQRGRPHAVLRLAPGTAAEAVIRAANERLEEHQRIRSHTLWTGDGELPRTEGTQKLKRRAIRDWVEAGGTPVAPAAGPGLEAVIAKYAGREVTGATSLEELGLSSLERVQMLIELEEKLGRPLDEASLQSVRTVGELRTLESKAAPVEELIEFPRWSRSWWARAWRRVSWPLWIGPLARLFLWVRVTGLENLRGVKGPVIFASNHQSYLDTAAVFLALPPEWRYRLAPAMRKEFFDAYFHPLGYGWAKRFRNSLAYYLACLGLNAYPLPQREAGTKQALRYAGELAAEGYSTLIFPEGRHTDGDAVGEFQPGVGMMASKLEVPVVPVRLRGVNRVLHPSWKMARPGRVEVHIGAPLEVRGEDWAAIARRVEEEVKKALP